MATTTLQPFQMKRLGIVMRPDPKNPHEKWGALNPGGVRGPDGAYYLFPRLVAEGNYSRIGRARVVFDQQSDPVSVERLGYALEPTTSYEVSRELSRAGGGVEDPRVTYVEPLQLFVMTYTAFTPPYVPRIALAISHDLVTWTRLGPLHYNTEQEVMDLNKCGNKDAVLFPHPVVDPQGQPAIAILHRPTHAVQNVRGRPEVVLPPGGENHPEAIWISYMPVNQVRADIRRLTHVDHSRMLMAPKADWEQVKIGSGVPPVRLPYGWLLLYHGVSNPGGADPAAMRYCAGAAVLDLQDPTKVLYRSASPILEPTLPEELHGTVAAVVFPTAADLRENERLDVYYGAADYVIGAARIDIPPQDALNAPAVSSAHTSTVTV